MATHIFTYDQACQELTRTEAVLTETHPLKREFPIGKNTFTVGKNKDNDVVIFDEYVSGYHFKIEFRDGKFFIKDLQSTNGTFLNQHQVVEAALSDNAMIEIGQTKFKFFAEQKKETVKPVQKDYFFGMVSDHPSMKEVFGLIESLRNSNSTVLIQGETGTGKELIARALHENSPRQSGRFISVNCGAIAKELIESELFGHEKGAFTGAVNQREGLFELAHGGTLFLDEIGELPIDLQPKLLRVLETGEIRRVGGSKNIHVDVRVITATHRDLPREIAAQRFREDLYYRIYVLPIVLPSLRDRKSDIPALVRHFLAGKKDLHSEALAKLMSHHWQGNIRELKNVIERANLISGSSQLINSSHIVFANVATTPIAPAKTNMTLEEIEKIAIREALEKNRWKKTETAAKLGIAKSTLHEKVKKYGLYEQIND